MRQKLVFLAVACLIALPLAAASNAPAQTQATAPAPAQVVNAQQAVPQANAAVNPLPLGVSPILSAVTPGRCGTNADCRTYCLQTYGSPYGVCVNYWCKCIV